MMVTALQKVPVRGGGEAETCAYMWGVKAQFPPGNRSWIHQCHFMMKRLQQQVWDQQGKGATKWALRKLFLTDSDTSPYLKLTLSTYILLQLWLVAICEPRALLSLLLMWTIKTP
jgi:hypothetical protein